jgi:hypothetical protein
MPGPVSLSETLTDGPFRNKERTRIKLLHSVGSILKKEGFVGLSVTNVAKKSGR